MVRKFAINYGACFLSTMEINPSDDNGGADVRRCSCGVSVIRGRGSYVRFLLIFLIKGILIWV